MFRLRFISFTLAESVVSLLPVLSSSVLASPLSIHLDSIHSLGLPVATKVTVDREEPYRILDIGNSYTDNYTAMLKMIAEGSGIDMERISLYKLTRSSGSFKSWSYCHADLDTQPYHFSRVLGAPVVTPDGDADPQDGSLMRRVLTEQPWDLIVLHQRSEYAHVYDQWAGDGDAGHLDDLLAIIHEEQPEAGIGFHIIHSYADWLTGIAGNGSLVRWQQIAESVRRLTLERDIDVVIPCGTAVESLRELPPGNPADYVSDGSHLAAGLGEYTAACTYFEAVIAPLFGVTVLGNPARYACPDGVRQGARYPEACVDVTDGNAPVAQQLAADAVATPYQLSTSGIDAVSSIAINEIMQSNVDALMVDGNFPDSWVELYNSSGRSVSLLGWGIGTSDDIRTSYRIRDLLVVPAHGFLLISCDKLGMLSHADFRLESTSDGSLYLFGPYGAVIDSLHYPKMPAPGIAYGRSTDGNGRWQHELTATPGAPNTGGGASAVAPSPVFSREGGVESVPFTLAVTIPEAGCPDDALLYWTTDGSEPDYSSMHGKEALLDIDRATVVRAKIISPGLLSPRSVTHSYIFHPRELTLPVVSLVTDSAHLYSEEYGILLGGQPSGTGNCYEDWRRPVNIEYFEEPGHAAVINQLCETEVCGKYSRTFSQKSLKLVANKRFGKKRFTAQLWPDDKPGITRVKSFRLRNGGNRCLDTRFEDALAQRIFGRWLGTLEWLAYTPVVAYINGEYKGIYGLRERTDDDYVEANFGITEEIDEEEDFYGHSPAYMEMHDLIKDDSSTFADFASRMEMDQFIDYLCCETFACNLDFPNNNVYMWRQKGGRWHFVLKDLDYFSQATYGYNYLNWLMITGPEVENALMNPISHRLIIRLLSMSEFREPFIDRMGTYMGDFLHPDVTLPLVHQMHDEIAGEVEATFQSMTENLVFENFENRVRERLIPFCEKRPHWTYQSLAQAFSLGDVVRMTVHPGGNSVLINGVGLTQDHFDGYTWTRRPLRLDSRNPAVGWRMTVSYPGGRTETFNYKHAEVSIRLEEEVGICDSIAFENIPIVPEDGIQHVVIDGSAAPQQSYNIYGMPAGKGMHGIRLVRDADGKYRKIMGK